MNVLVIAPHPDDECLGCGGAICSHVEAGDRVAVAFLTSGERGVPDVSPDELAPLREREAEQAAKVLGVSGTEFFRGTDSLVRKHRIQLTTQLVATLLREQPQLVYLPHPEDGHADHTVVLSMVQTALADETLPVPELRGYEVWAPMRFYDHTLDVTDFMPRKIRALRCHRSQLRDLNYVRAIRGLNAYRGAIAGRWDYAEVFQKLSPR